VTQTSRLARLAVAAGLFAVGVTGCALPLGAPAVRRPVAPTDRPAPASVFAPTGPTQLGRVVRITDGDTIRVVVDGQEQRLRYIGIDTPERAGPGGLAEPFAAEATLVNTKLVRGKEVALERDASETDRYDRLLRYVWLSPDLDNATTDDDAWRLVNLELVRAGLAEAIRYPPDTKYDAILESAESEARAARRGMWAED
jgi:micrococcal nuclease